jgi:hypothetical protein
MKRTFLLIAMCIMTFISVGQTTTFTPGWYIVEKGATYASYDPITLASGIDESFMDSSISIIFGLKAGETVFATELSADIFYCYDPSGTPILIKGKQALTKAPQGFGVGIISSEIQLLSGVTLTEGMYVWIIGQDVAKQTIKIQLSSNQILDIPETKIGLLTALLKKNSKATLFKEVE